MRQQTMLLLTTVLIPTVTASGCSSSSGSMRQSANSAIEPQAQSILQAMCDALSAAETFRVRVRETTDEVLETGGFAQFSSERTVTCSRPDRLYMTCADDDGRHRAWYNGQTLTVLSVDDNQFAAIDAPKTTEALFDMLIDQYDINVPLAELFVGHPCQMLAANVTAGMPVGNANIDESNCHHLAFRQDVIDWQLWVDAGPTALPRKVVINYKQEPGNPQFTATLDQWDLKPDVSDDLFTFVAPAQAQRVELSQLINVEYQP